VIPPGREKLHELMLLETIDGNRIGEIRDLELEEGMWVESSRGSAWREKRIIYINQMWS
jgi:hypothetical protein